MLPFFNCGIWYNFTCMIVLIIARFFTDMLQKMPRPCRTLWDNTNANFHDNYFNSKFFISRYLILSRWVLLHNSITKYLNCNQEITSNCVVKRLEWPNKWVLCLIEKDKIFINNYSQLLPDIAASWSSGIKRYL